VEIGAQVKFAPEVTLTVALEPERALVLRGGIPMGRMPVPYDFTWAFVLRGLSQPGKDPDTRDGCGLAAKFRRGLAACRIDSTPTHPWACTARSARTA
jgi:hypothetical protein